MLAVSTLGVPHRITGNVRVSFRGAGRARFRLQHTADRNGEPEALSWCEVSAMSDARLADPRDAVDGDGMVRGVLVNFVDGDLELLYRRHTADWLRLIPHDDEDEENIERCARYDITVEPIARASDQCK
jgi:hypothetical protein